MKRQQELCRALSNHAWEIVGPIVVLGDKRRITLHCARCDTWRNDTWARATGVTLARSYKHASAYKSFIKENKHADARIAILAAPTLRVVKGRRKLAS